MSPNPYANVFWSRKYGNFIYRARSAGEIIEGAVHHIEVLPTTRTGKDWAQVWQDSRLVEKAPVLFSALYELVDKQRVPREDAEYIIRLLEEIVNGN